MDIQEQPLLSIQLDTEMRKAIIADKVEFDRAIRKSDEEIQLNPRRVLVRFMDNQDRNPEEVICMSLSHQVFRLSPGLCSIQHRGDIRDTPI
jgi:hypothetical protein